MGLLDFIKQKAQDRDDSNRTAKALSEIEQATLPSLIRIIREATDSNIRICAIDKLSQIDDEIVDNVLTVALIRYIKEKDTAMAISNAMNNLKGKAAAHRLKIADIPMVKACIDLRDELLSINAASLTDTEAMRELVVLLNEYRLFGLDDGVTDIDSNGYKSVKIGNQIWTIENYKSTKFNDGSTIPLITDSGKWCKLKSPGYCWYDNNIINKDKYGALYNEYAVKSKIFAPKGWHVSTDNDWNILERYLSSNGYNWDGTKTWDKKHPKLTKCLADKTDWVDTAWLSARPGSDVFGEIGRDLSKNNGSGFSALPGGYRSGNGPFEGIKSNGYWWSLPTLRFLCSSHAYLCKDAYLRVGLSVRLVRD